MAKKHILMVIVFFLLAISVSSTELRFEKNYCAVGEDCMLNDLYLTGNFSFIGDIVNVTILNQNITGQLSVDGNLDAKNITADNFFGNLIDDVFWNIINFTTQIDLFIPDFWELENFTEAYDNRLGRWQLANSTALGYLTNDTSANITQLTTYNISSPYANKSYIYFLEDGSIGITLDPVEDPPPTEDGVTRTASTETTCVNGVCNLVLYSGVRFVEEEGKWKDVREAKSLKGIFNKVILKNDEDYEIEFDDYNYTYIKKLKIKSEVGGNIPFKIGNTTYVSPYFEEGEEIEIEDIYVENILAYNFTLGESSTTIILQDADTENLEDAYVRDNFPDHNRGIDDDLYLVVGGSNGFYRIYIKFDISSIPSGQVIDDAQFSLYKHSNVNTGTSDISVYHVYNNTWVEGSGNHLDVTGQSAETNISWNNQPCGTGFDDAVQCNLNYETNIEIDTTSGTFFNWAVTNTISEVYGGGERNVSLVLKAKDEVELDFGHRFKSKEYSTASLRPYLNITYSEIPPQDPTITTTLISPPDASIDEDGAIDFECSATTTFSNITNISFYHNNSGTWDLIETDLINDSIYEGTNTSEFSVTGIGNNTILAWNCESFNNASNSSFASANYTVRIGFPVHDKNPQFFIQNMSGIKQWFVDSRGDMWLRDALEIEGNLLVDAGTLFVDSVNDWVGIGTTSPGAKLEVAGNIVLDGNARRLYLGSTSGTDEGDIYKVDQIYGYNDLRLYGKIPLTGPDPDLIINGNGYVGINTPSPTHKLEVAGGVNLNNSLYVNESTGYVGIGTATPTTKLNVVGGDINVTGNITGNQIYGEMYNYSPHATPWTFDITEDDVYFNLTGLVAGNLNGFGFSNGTVGEEGSHLIAEVDGLYKACLSMSFLSNAVGGDFGISVARNFDETQSRDCYSRREASTNIGNVGVCCLIGLEGGDTVNIKVENEDNTRDMIIHTVNLNLMRVGD